MQLKENRGRISKSENGKINTLMAIYGRKIID